jgi:methyl-accepting chemotaxis protein
MEATDEIISNCEHVRGAFYKAIIFKQNAEIEESLKVFPEIDKDIRAIKEKSAADQQGDLLKMQQHAQDVEALLKQTLATLKELAELAPKRLAMLDKIAENAKTSAIGGIEATEKVAATSSEKLDASSRVMLGGLVAVVLLGTLLAIVMTLNILRPVKEIVARIKDIAQGEGDLTQRVHLSSNDEIGELASWFNKFIERVHGIISEVAAATREVSSAATQIAASSEEMSTGMREQSSQTQQVSSAVEEMSSTVIEVAQKSAEAANNAETAGRQAGTGGEVVHRTIAGIQEIEKVVSSSAEVITELGERGEQIGAIIGVINDIADQTNLLALNAAIEAARAGEHGRGFAVVADEVRKLAERTTHATKEVAESIIAIQHETKDAVQRISAGTVRVSEGVDLAREAGTALEMIVASASGVSGMIQSIAAASEQQSAAAEQIARNIESINAITRQSSDGVAQAAAAAMQLSAKSEQLQHLVGQFKI